MRNKLLKQDGTATALARAREEVQSIFSIVRTNAPSRRRAGHKKECEMAKLTHEHNKPPRCVDDYVMSGAFVFLETIEIACFTLPTNRVY